jgi:signal transduction histidine kinase
MKPRARSLRHKLTVWYLVVFSAIQLTLVFAVVLFRWDTLRDTVDNGIESSTRVLIENLLVDEKSSDEWTADYIGSMLPTDRDFVLFALRDATGTVSSSSGILAEQELPFSDEEVVPTGPMGGVFTTLGREHVRRLAGIDSALRLLTMPFRSDGKEYFMQVGVRDDPLFLSPLTDLLLMGIPVALLAALVTSWFIAGRAVAPIQRLSDAARSVSPTSLGERISVETTDHEISKLQTELNSALSRLEAGYRAQEQFISNVSHELKTPLAVLLTETQILHLGQETLERYRGWAERV